MAKICGVYTITNKINRKMYVGYSSYIQDRLCHHKADLRKNQHRNCHLQKSFNRNGEENFEFQILDEYPEELLVAMEHYWTTVLNTLHRDFGYNIEPTNPTSRYPKRSLETRDKVREARKRQVITKEHREAVSKALKGRKGISRPTSEETKVKLSESLKKGINKKGCWRTDGEKENLRKIQRAMNGKPIIISYQDGRIEYSDSIANASEITGVKLGTIWANIKYNRINQKTGIQFKYKEV